MAVLFSTLEPLILRILQKESTYQGFFTTQKVMDAVNDSIEYLSARMMQNGEGWLRYITLLDTVAATATVALPAGCSVVHVVRYKRGQAWFPLAYNDKNDEVQYDSTAVIQYPSSFRLIQNDLYFNPVPGSSETGVIQIEYSKYPTAVSSAGSEISAQFDNAMLQYVKWRSASQLVSQVGKNYADWKDYENEWYVVVKELIGKKVRSAQYIKPFDI